MSTLQWSESLVLGVPLLDDAHHALVDSLALVSTSADDALLPHWQGLIAQAERLFAQEDGWMCRSKFSSSSCHAMQHKVILQVMREGAQRGQAGERDVVRQMAYEFGLWFPRHVQSMDAALALHLRSAGFGAATGEAHALGTQCEAVPRPGRDASPASLPVLAPAAARLSA